MKIKKEDFEVFDKHLDKDGSYKSLGNNRWYNHDMFVEVIKNTDFRFNYNNHIDYADDFDIISKPPFASTNNADPTLKQVNSILKDKPKQFLINELLKAYIKYPDLIHDLKNINKQKPLNNKK